VVGGGVAPYTSLTVGCCPPPRASAPSSFFTEALTLPGPSAEPFQRTKSREKDNLFKTQQFPTRVVQ